MSPALQSSAKSPGQKAGKKPQATEQPTHPTLQNELNADTRELLDYAVSVENRLRKELHIVLKQLDHERERSRKLERKLREMEFGYASPRGRLRTGNASPLGRAESPSGLSDRRSLSPVAAADSPSYPSRGGARTAAGMRAPNPSSPSAWLLQRGGTGRPLALDRPDPADAMRSKPALLTACEHAIANDLRRLERSAASAPDGAAAPGRARLEVFQATFDAVIANFHVYGPLLSRIKAEYDAALRWSDAALERAAATKVAERAEHHIAVHQASVTLAQRVRELEAEVAATGARAARYEAELRDATRQVADLQKLERAARILRRRSEESLEEAQRLNDAMVMERRHRILAGDADPHGGAHDARGAGHDGGHAHGGRDRRHRDDSLQGRHRSPSPSPPPGHDRPHGSGRLGSEDRAVRHGRRLSRGGSRSDSLTDSVRGSDRDSDAPLCL